MSDIGQPPEPPSSTGRPRVPVRLGGGRRHWSKVAPRVKRQDRTDASGRVFDSRDEMAWYLDLELQERSGLIRNLRRQVTYTLFIPQGPDERPDPILIRSPGFPNGVQARYTVDAEYDEPGAPEGRAPRWLPAREPLTPLGWRHVYKSFKGHATPQDTLRQAFFEALHRVRVDLAGPQAKRNARRAEVIRANRSRLRKR